MKNREPADTRRSSSGRRHSPTREALLRDLESQRDPSSIAELAESTGWHQNTVRGHLRALWQDGYVSRIDGEPDGRGRPSWRWAAKPGRPESAYAALAGVLADAVARLSPDPAREGREAGRVWGRAIAAELPRPGTEAELHEQVVDVMRDQGFAPVVAARSGAVAGAVAGAATGASTGSFAEAPGRETDGRETHGHRADAPSRARHHVDGTSIVLRQCPLIEAASTRSDVVCAVHLGMVAGLMEAHDPGGDGPCGAGSDRAGSRRAGADGPGSDHAEGSTVTVGERTVRLLPFTAPGECVLQLADGR
ncbi:hypothetical protein LEUCIP111803_00880 [Leucobacter soli]|uniref:HTH iclR-type domain-containing protein n=2 Tax=Leucobacter soli TaxID=2812850 RepID=A0A916JUZ3_9MICO|nr:helix-turn-helix domain-containing protein [Leucobacter soli]CAG7606026.1 hypothetical protein LEUCIP111803_00880 [Leucobacter soli]